MRATAGPKSSQPTDANHQFTVVAVGASAGGLEAFSAFLDAFPAKSGIAIIFVQHLDPTHKSMIVNLLISHTKMSVQEAVDGVLIKPNNVYVIAPGTSLGVRDGALIVSEPKERHGARMPFDSLLRSLAEAYGEPRPSDNQRSRRPGHRTIASGSR
jgi:two-component system, chemotaxis family, CheB/CheR fusion protein